MCIASGPDTESIYQTYKNENFQAICLDIWDGTYNQVQSYKNQTGITYPMCLDASASGADYGVPRDYSVIVDQDGIVQFIGFSVNVNVVSNKIEELLGVTPVEKTTWGQIKSLFQQ